MMLTQKQYNGRAFRKSLSALAIMKGSFAFHGTPTAMRMGIYHAKRDDFYHRAVSCWYSRAYLYFSVKPHEPAHAMYANARANASFLDGQDMRRAIELHAGWPSSFLVNAGRCWRLGCDTAHRYHAKYEMKMMIDISMYISLCEMVYSWRGLSNTAAWWCMAANIVNICYSLFSRRNSLVFIFIKSSHFLWKKRFIYHYCEREINGGLCDMSWGIDDFIFLTAKNIT